MRDNHAVVCQSGGRPTVADVVKCNSMEVPARSLAWKICWMSAFNCFPPPSSRWLLIIIGATVPILAELAVPVPRP